MRLILQTLCQIQRTSSSLRYMNCGPGHVQSTYSSTYSGFNIQLNVSALLLEISRQFSVRYTANLVPNTAHILQFTLCELWFRPCTMLLQLRIFRVQYSSERICAASGGTSAIKWALTANMVPNIAHILQFTLRELWFRTYTKHLQLRIYRPQYSTERICAAIGDITTIQCALYCKLGAKYSAHPPVYAM
jgi:hypothetical protein